jgi:RNA polymerase sigma-70 factor, ECF subfamily
MPDDQDTALRFEATALPFADALYNKALYLTGAPEDARDLVQETYLRAYRTFSRFKEGTNCKAWLFTILYSIFTNRYRRAQREPETVSLESLARSFHDSLASDEWPANFAILSSSQTEWQEPEVREALRKLPESFYSAILLVDVEGFTYEEAAMILACPLGTVRSRLFRARRMLFLELYEYAKRMRIIRPPHA